MGISYKYIVNSYVVIDYEDTFIPLGHSFLVTLPAQNLFGQKEAILYYNNVNKNLLIISKPGHNIMEKCSLLALWNMSEVKSFGASGSKLVIQTKKSASQGACHLSFQTLQARRIVHLLQNKCEEGCSCCCKPHPFSQMANNLTDSSNGSSSDSDDEISLVHVEVRSKSLQRLDDIDLTPKTNHSGRKTPEPASSHKLLKKKAATIDTRLSSRVEYVDDGKSKDTLLQSFLFSPQHMNKFNSDSGISPTRVSQTMKPQKSLPLLDSKYEEIKPAVSSPASKQSLYEEIPDDFRKAAIAYRGSWGGKQLSQESAPQETERTPHAFYKEGSLYEAMNRQEQVSNPQASQLNSEDSYVCMHSLSNRSSSLSLKPVASDSQLTTNHNSSIPLYMNTTNHRNSSPLAYANLADMGSTGNLAYAEISDTIIPNSRRSAERSLSPETNSIPYTEIDHNLTEALRKTSAQRRPVCRAQTLDTAEHKKMPHKKWLAKLTARRT